MMRLYQLRNLSTYVCNVTSAESSTTAALYLFDSDTGTPYTQEADFFSTISTLHGIIADNVQATHQHHAHICPIAATFG